MDPACRSVWGGESLGDVYDERTATPVAGWLRSPWTVTVRGLRRYDSAAMVAAGHNVAVVVNVTRGHALPDTFMGLPVVDGDASDDRTQDRAGAWVMLRAKGQAIGDTSGFVVGVTTG